MTLTTELNTANVFRRSIARYGEPWRLSDPRSHDALGLEELRALFQINISLQKRAIGPRGFVHFDYLDNRSFNAMAWTRASYDFVSLFSGSIFHLYRLFFCFLSDPKTLPSLGDASREVLAPLVLDAIRGRDQTSNAFQHPSDNIRYQAAQNFALVSCLLVLNHEIGHIAHCHPHFMNQHFGMDVFAELPIVSRSEEENQLLRAFEWEADEYAGVTTYQVLHHLGGLLEGIKELPIDYVLSAAGYMLFLYIHRHSGKAFNTESPTHPAPQHRWLWMMHEIETHQRCKQFQPNSENIGRGIHDVAAFWWRNQLFEKSEMEPSSTWQDDLKNAYDKVRNTLKDHAGELSAIESKRNESGQAWHKLNQPLVKSFSAGAFEHLQKGVVTRPCPDQAN